jgi:hypothetical protein
MPINCFPEAQLSQAGIDWRKVVEGQREYTDQPGNKVRGECGLSWLNTLLRHCLSTAPVSVPLLTMQGCQRVGLGGQRAVSEGIGGLRGFGATAGRRD